MGRSIPAVRREGRNTSSGFTLSVSAGLASHYGRGRVREGPSDDGTASMVADVVTTGEFLDVAVEVLWPHLLVDALIATPEHGL